MTEDEDDLEMDEARKRAEYRGDQEIEGSIEDMYENAGLNMDEEQEDEDGED